MIISVTDGDRKVVILSSKLRQNARITAVYWNYNSLTTAYLNKQAQ
ncbi:MULTISPECIES: hypothetical protein [unclassified Nostoc]|nr:hypothetical protein [Nostoc sp. NOS(2021)]